MRTVDRNGDNNDIDDDDDDTEEEEEVYVYDKSAKDDKVKIKMIMETIMITVMIREKS